MTKRWRDERKETRDCDEDEEERKDESQEASNRIDTSHARNETSFLKVEKGQGERSFREMPGEMKTGRKGRKKKGNKSIRPMQRNQKIHENKTVQKSKW